MESEELIKVSDYIAQFLFEKGLRHVFMVTGGGAMHLNDSFVRSQPFTVTFNHHEQAAAMAAEGLFRATGKLAVVNVTTGPGGLNALNGLLGQWTDSIPAIYISGQVKFETTLMSCRELPLRQLGDQEVDIITLVKPLTKYAVSVVDPLTIRRELETAVHEALSGRKGPVWLDVPMNVQGSLVDEASLIGAQLGPETPKKIDLGPALSGLAKAKRPLVVAGHGVRLSGTRGALLELLEQWKVPVVTTFNGFDLIPNDHPCYSGRIGTLGTRGGNFTLQNADFVLFLGTRNNIRQVSYNWDNFAHRAETISIDIDAAELNKPTFQPSLKLHADLSAVLPDLVREGAAVSSLTGQDGLIGPKKGRDAIRVHARISMRKRGESIRMRSWNVGPSNFPPTLLWFLAMGQLAWPFSKPVWSRMDNGCFGTRVVLPWGTICLRLLEPPQVERLKSGVLPGDGSLQMNLQELATMAYHRFPIKLVYLNNGGYASIRQTQENFFGSQYGCGVKSGLGFPDMEKLASAYGLPYFRSSDISEVGTDAANVCSVDGPVIWEIMLKLDYSFEPKLSSERLPDGRMISKPLEDMFPFLPREEFNSNMYLESEEAAK